VPGSGEAVRAAGLTRLYGSTRAVDGIDFSVRAGECFGVLGPNGAGKTTTVRMVHAFTPITAGDLFVLGRDVRRWPRAVKAAIGVCPQENNLDEDFTVLKNLLVYARYFDISRKVARQRADELLDFVGLAEQAGRRIATLSGGMKRRLVLARALLNSPRLLVLDEPTTGLDPQTRHQVWHRVRGLKRIGTTILLTTHYMEEASQICDRLVIMDHGKILIEGPPAQLVRQVVGREVVEVENAGRDVDLAVAEAGLRAERAGDRLCIRVDAGSARSGEQIHAALAHHFPGHQVILRNATLEDVFLSLTGRELRE
jgi:lipooligosaccharide transport system ATP-binding protein